MKKRPRFASRGWKSVFPLLTSSSESGKWLKGPPAHFRNSGPTSSTSFISWSSLPGPFWVSAPNAHRVRQQRLHRAATGSDKGKSVNLGGLEHRKRWYGCYGLVQGSGETMDRGLRLPSHPQVSAIQGILHWRKYSRGQQADSSEFQSSTPNDTQYRWPCGQCGVCTSQVVGQSCSEFNRRLPPFYPVRVNSETRSRHPQTSQSLPSSYWSQGGPKCVSNPWQLSILLV